MIDRGWVEEIKGWLPELPQVRRNRFIEEYGLPEYDADIITGSRALADYFEECCRQHRDPKAVSNWIMGELLRCLNNEGLEITESRVTPGDLAAMLRLIDQGTISGKIAKTVFEEMFMTGKDPQSIVKEKGLVQITDEDAISGIVDKVLAANPQVVEDLKNGKDKALGFLVGQVMKETRGKASPEIVNRLLRDKL